MKVLINATIYEGGANGLGVYTENILKSLEAKIQDAEVISFSPINSLFKVTLLRYGWLQKLFSLKSLSLYRLIWNLFFLPFYARRFDIVYSVSPHGSFFLQNKQIVTVHDLIGLDRKINFNQFIYYRTILPLLLRRCKKVISISNTTKKELIKEISGISEKIVTIYNGADHLKGSINQANTKFNLEKDKYFLVVGASYPHKNIERVLSVFKEIKDYKLVVVHGNNGYSRKLAASSGLMSNVVFASKLSHAELASLYRNAKGNIYVSLKEGFGFPPFEAILNQTVSIVSKIDCLFEIYGEESVIYVDPFSEHDIAVKIRKLINNNFDKEAILKGGSLRLAQYTWEKTSDGLVSLFSSLHGS